MIKFRTLKADEVEVRPQSIKNGKANMLLYIDSRCVTNLLDETVGSFNWQSEFYEVNGQTIGKLGIWDAEKEQWIWKSDVGTESNIEAEKGLISDTYKRLLSRWGVCELYSSPKIQIDDDGYGNTGYKVTEIEYDNNRKIIFLVIANRFGKEVFRWSKNAKTQPTNKPIMAVREDLEWKPSEGEAVNKVDYRQMLTDFCAVQKTVEGVDRDNLLKFFNFYGKRVDDWRGDFDPQRLWDRWNSKKSA